MYTVLIASDFYVSVSFCRVVCFHSSKSQRQEAEKNIHSGPRHSYIIINCISFQRFDEWRPMAGYNERRDEINAERTQAETAKERRSDLAWEHYHCIVVERRTHCAKRTCISCRCDTCSEFVRVNKCSRRTMILEKNRVRREGEKKREKCIGSLRTHLKWFELSRVLSTRLRSNNWQMVVNRLRLNWITCDNNRWTEIVCEREKETENV